MIFHICHKNYYTMVGGREGRRGGEGSGRGEKRGGGEEGKGGGEEGRGAGKWGEGGRQGKGNKWKVRFTHWKSSPPIIN